MSKFIIRKRTVDTNIMIKNMAFNYDPNNILISLREIIGNHQWGKATEVYCDFYLEQQLFSILDNGSGIKDRNQLVVDVGSPAEHMTGFQGLNQGIQALQHLTNCLTIITKNDQELFKQEIYFPIDVREFESNNFSEEEKTLVNGWLNKGFNTFTYMKWRNNKKALTPEIFGLEIKEKEDVKVCIVDFVRKTFEWAIRLNKVKIFVRFNSNDVYEKLTPFDYAKEEDCINIYDKTLSYKETPVHLRIYHLVDISSKTHYGHGDHASVYMSTTGIRPNILQATYKLTRDDAIVSLNYDELVDSIKGSSGKETFTKDITFVALKHMVSNLIKELLPVTAIKLNKKQDLLNEKISDAINESLKQKKIKIGEDSPDPLPKIKFICEECGKEIWSYTCKYCGHNPKTPRRYLWKCNFCFEKVKDSIPDELLTNERYLSRRQKAEFGVYQRGWTWVSFSRKEEKCPKCGSEDIQLANSSKHLGNVIVSTDLNRSDILTLVLDLRGVNFIIGGKHPLYKLVVPENISKSFSAILGIVSQATLLVPDFKQFTSENGEKELLVHRDSWNAQADEMCILFSTMKKW